MSDRKVMSAVAFQENEQEEQLRAINLLNDSSEFVGDSLGVDSDWLQASPRVISFLLDNGVPCVGGW